jgi:hypothetical protein
MDATIWWHYLIEVQLPLVRNVRKCGTEEKQMSNCMLLLFFFYILNKVDSISLSLSISWNSSFFIFYFTVNMYSHKA